MTMQQPGHRKPGRPHGGSIPGVHTLVQTRSDQAGAVGAGVVETLADSLDQAVQAAWPHDFLCELRPSWRRIRVGWRPCFPLAWRKMVGHGKRTNGRTGGFVKDHPPGVWAQAPPGLLRQSSAFAWRGTVLRDVASQRNRRQRAVSAVA
ncbi:MAG: hypothetical protein CXZ00_16900 [Acidobacteria bacterium]|nr:MAG: hypothetical protein CXZ00_16900 [Acidobacteriota bacterium]